MCWRNRSPWLARLGERWLGITAALPPQARVVANGFSCRQQMRAQGDARATHLAVLLRDALMLADRIPRRVPQQAGVEPGMG